MIVAQGQVSEPDSDLTGIAMFEKVNSLVVENSSVEWKLRDN